MFCYINAFFQFRDNNIKETASKHASDVTHSLQLQSAIKSSFISGKDVFIWFGKEKCSRLLSFMMYYTVQSIGMK